MMKAMQFHPLSIVGSEDSQIIWMETVSYKEHIIVELRVCLLLQHFSTRRTNFFSA